MEERGLLERVSSLSKTLPPLLGVDVFGGDAWNHT